MQPLLRRVPWERAQRPRPCWQVRRPELSPNEHELRLVEEGLLLLLELARVVELRSELEGGSWVSDLLCVTRHVIGKAHPALAPLALAAKVLQNGLQSVTGPAT